MSVSELLVLNVETLEWKEIMSKAHPTERTDFSFTQISQNAALLFGGATSPNDVFFDDLWLFEVEEGKNLFLEKRKQIHYDCWKELPSRGNEVVGRKRGHAAQFISGYLFVFGGLDSYKVCYNSIYRYNFNTYKWEFLNCKSKLPAPRAYHEMGIVNKDYLFVYGGLLGDLTNIKHVYNDCYLYNIEDNVWVEAVIGGIQPSPRYGYSMLKINNGTFHDQHEKSSYMSSLNVKKQKTQPFKPINLPNNKKEIKQMKAYGGIVIFGGFTRDGHDTKIYELIQYDSYSKFYWNIRDSNYEEGENDDMFLVQSETKINDYIQRINKNELEIGIKEQEIIDMNIEIENKKKEIFNNFGFIDDNSQTMEDLVRQLEGKNQLLKKIISENEKIILLKQRLKFIIQRKKDKSMDFFCHSQNLFVKLYDTMIKCQNSNTDKTQTSEKLLNIKKVNEIKNNFIGKVSKLQQNLNILIDKEDKILGNLKNLRKDVTFEEVFKGEIDSKKK